ncbi:prepilin-type N-terminal cleavage/methylation domain-containing protein [Coralloluteibacterium thermophilus]|uniref:Prepilin-type N-terminal cleavage/methylation domain-containing protein n=1 Tax=Coralloluteibacterium thermophilum TaxID=2707049 RepID=A0ABV9NS03_9GAMM
MRRAAGFTLIEIVLATALLAAGLVLAYATLRTATGLVQRAEDIAVRTDRLRAVQGFLRRQLQVAQPVAFEREVGGPGIVFQGDAGGVRFVGPMPGYLARGGRHLQELVLVREGDALLLRFEHRLMLDETPIEDPEPRPPEVLLRGIAEAAFEFRGVEDDGSVGDWERGPWQTPERLPVAVALRLVLADGSRWPLFEVPLMMGTHGADGPSVPLEPPP